MNSTKLLQQLQSGACDQNLAELYALGGGWAGLDRGKRRAIHVVETFQRRFGQAEQAILVSGPGRTELGGNHTDHQHGHVLCGSIDLDMLACAAPNGNRFIRIYSESFPELEVDLADLTPRPEEHNRSEALARGVAAGVSRLGYPVSGFDACVVSDVRPGSGLSSSAAYEVLLGNIMNQFCCQGTLDPVQIAKIGQYAENVYFGKPCGLMDQMGASLGGAVAIDFENPQLPRIQRVNYDFSASGYALCIVDTGSYHADLTDDYAEITGEMRAVAGCFGKQVLRQVPEEQFWCHLAQLRPHCGDRGLLRGMHFYNEERRVLAETQALDRGDFEAFLGQVRASGVSSALYLQNIWSVSAPKQQPVSLALALGERLLGGRGAVRVHGGGFAGTIQAFVPWEILGEFQREMEAFLGKGTCHVLQIRPRGGCVVLA